MQELYPQTNKNRPTIESTKEFPRLQNPNQTNQNFRYTNTPNTTRNHSTLADRLIQHQNISTQFQKPPTEHQQEHTSTPNTTHYPHTQPTPINYPIYSRRFPQNYTTPTLKTTPHTTDTQPNKIDKLTAIVTQIQQIFNTLIRDEDSSISENPAEDYKIIELGSEMHKFLKKIETITKQTPIKQKSHNE